MEMRVVSFEDGPTVDSHFYDYLKETVYANTTAPVWMRSGFRDSTYFKVHGKEPMPADLIGLPEEWLEDFGLGDDNEYHLFFFLKPGFAHQMSQSILWGADYDEARSDD